MQKNLDETGEKKETLVELLVKFKEENDFDMDVDIPDSEVDYKNYSLEFSRVFIQSFKDFRNKFKYCADAEDLIIKLTPICANLSAWNMEYCGGVELGDFLALNNIKGIIQSNFFPIDDFIKIYSEVKEE